MGPHDLPATTRLVLCAHVQFMNRKGGNCWVGVRRLAVAANLDKGTVAEHRAAAIAAGWLIASDHSRYSRSRTVLAAIPDEFGADMSVDAKSQPSGPAVQSIRQVARRLYGRSASTVRFERPDCTARPYLSSIPYKDLQERAAHRSAHAPAAKIRPEQSEATAAELIAWFAHSDSGKRYAHDPGALERVTPMHLRFPGYEAVIRTAIDGAKPENHLDTDGHIDEGAK